MRTATQGNVRSPRHKQHIDNHTHMHTQRHRHQNKTHRKTHYTTKHIPDTQTHRALGCGRKQNVDTHTHTHTYTYIHTHTHIHIHMKRHTQKSTKHITLQRDTSPHSISHTRCRYPAVSAAQADGMLMIGAPTAARIPTASTTLAVTSGKKYMSLNIVTPHRIISAAARRVPTRTNSSPTNLPSTGVVCV
jgi:hypothetical protein